MNATVHAHVFLNTRTQQMGVVPNENVFGSGLCGFLQVCIHLKIELGL